MSSKFMFKVRRSRIYASVQSLKPSTLVAFTFMLLPVVAHAQGTMDFSGAQTLMGTFNSRFAYVSVSRASHDAQIYTSDAASLAVALSHDATKTSAVETARTHVIAQSVALAVGNQPNHDIGTGFSL